MSRQDEKMVAVAMPGAEWSLEGIYMRAEGDERGGAVVAPPHPLYGGSMDNPVVGELAWALRRSGHATLRFNWRGVGASGGAPSGEPDAALADYGAALEHMLETAPGTIVAAGYSFGAVAAARLAAASPRVRRLLLVAPPPSMLDAAALDDAPDGVLVLVGSQDTLAPEAGLRARLGDDPPRRLEVIPDADHFFGQGLAEIGRRAARWLGPGD